MSLLQNLADIRDKQGLSPLPDPRVIQGFEPGSPPAPDYRPEIPTQPADPFGLDDDPPTQPAASPLIPRPTPKPQVDMPPAPLNLPDLMVIGTTGVWKGREVALTDKEERKVRGVVLSALQRELRDDLLAAGVRRVSRQPRKPEAASEAPKRRGHPRKVTP